MMGTDGLIKRHKMILAAAREVLNGRVKRRRVRVSFSRGKAPLGSHKMAWVTFLDKNGKSKADVQFYKERGQKNWQWDSIAG